MLCFISVRHWKWNDYSKKRHLSFTEIKEVYNLVGTELLYKWLSLLETAAILLTILQQRNIKLLFKQHPQLWNHFIYYVNFCGWMNLCACQSKNVLVTGFQHSLPFNDCSLKLNVSDKKCLYARIRSKVVAKAGTTF